MTAGRLALSDRLERELARTQSGSAAELRGRLGVSQATFSRLVSGMGDRLLVVGRARSTRYAARRQAADLEDRIPVCEVGEDGSVRRLARLHAVLPEGYYVEPSCEDVDAAFHRDLPYFLHDLRPAGFLGRIVPRQHPELELPADVRLWTANDVLRYATRHGWNLPGSFIIGEAALSLFLRRSAEPPVAIELRERRRRYPQLATDVLLGGAAGSSAAGEQPKFLATKAPGVEVLVKFSAQGRDARSRREADLLIAEHLALRVLEDHGEEAARSELIVASDQVFLEVERFDRVPGAGRRGVLSLFSLDAEYLGSMKGWTDSVTRLAGLGQVPKSAVHSTRLRELFGRLIGNTDMHAGNLSFFARGSRVLSLAPVYDMLPMLYAGAPVPGRELALPAPALGDAGVWREASRAALELWKASAREARVSASFKKIARENAARVEAWRKAASRLPT